jgi:hypothetical protein
MIRTPRSVAHRGHLGAVLLALALAIAGAGCYTLIRHPQSGEPVDARSDEICYSCHASDDDLDLELYPWADYYSHSSSPWVNYYAAPWWYDARWEWAAPPTGGDNSATSERPRSDRYGWGRHPRTATVPDSLRPRDNSLPPAPIVSTPPVAPLTPAIPTQSPPSGNSGTSDENKKKETKEPQRRTLRR